MCNAVFTLTNIAIYTKIDIYATTTYLYANGN